MNAPSTKLDRMRVSSALPRICVIGPLPPPFGGMANQCEQLVRLLRGEGVEVEVVRSNRDYSPRWIEKLPVVRAGFRLVPYLIRLWRASGRGSVVHVLANSGWAWHLFAAPAVWIGKLRGSRVLVNYRGGLAGEFLADASWHVRRTLAIADELVTPSAFLQRAFAPYGLRTTIVPNIIDLSRFAPSPPRRFGDAPHLIVTRNLEPIYDIPTAIRGFAIVRERFPNARLSIAGSGPEEVRLRALIRSMGLDGSVTLCGRMENAAIAGMYASADCMLNPSTVDNMPISILEAYASGVPVVSTNAGGIPDIAENGVDSLLVPVGDHVALGSQALRVLSDPELTETLRSNGFERARQFAWPSVRDRWFEIYRRLGAAEGIQ